jgi:hypothetical protein
MIEIVHDLLAYELRQERRGEVVMATQVQPIKEITNEAGAAASVGPLGNISVRAAMLISFIITTGAGTLVAYIISFMAQ